MKANSFEESVISHRIIYQTEGIYPLIGHNKRRFENQSDYSFVCDMFNAILGTQHKKGNIKYIEFYVSDKIHTSFSPTCKVLIVNIDADGFMQPHSQSEEPRHQIITNTIKHYCVEMNQNLPEKQNIIAISTSEIEAEIRQNIMLFFKKFVQAIEDDYLLEFMDRKQEINAESYQKVRENKIYKGLPEEIIKQKAQELFLSKFVLFFIGKFPQMQIIPTPINQEVQQYETTN